MQGIVVINDQEITVKEFNKQRVVTFKDIDTLHKRPEGTAGRNFRENKDKLFEGSDYFRRNSSEAKNEFGIVAPNGLVLLTESGYLMLVKSFNDDLAWQVQRQLVTGYFRAKTIFQDLSPELQFMIKMELKQKEMEMAITETKEDLKSIRDTVVLNPNSWRDDTKTLIVKMAQKLGGNEYIRTLRNESYDLLNKRMGVSVETRLTNKRRRMAEEGVCKSKRDSLNPLDVIADDKKLIEGYLAIIKEMVIKYGI